MRVFMVHSHVQAGPARRGEPCRLVESEQTIHPLHAAAGGALVQIIEHAHDGDGSAVGDGMQMRVIARGHILHPRRRGNEAHERAVAVVLGERRLHLGARARLLERRLHRDMNAARERTRVGHEVNFRRDAARPLGASRDFRRVPMCERSVSVHIAVTQRMVRALDRFAPRTGAASDARDEEPGFDEPEASRGTLASRAAVAKQPGCAMCGVGATSRCSGTAQVNEGMRAGAPCACL